MVGNGGEWWGMVRNGGECNIEEKRGMREKPDRMMELGEWGKRYEKRDKVKGQKRLEQ